MAPTLKSPTVNFNVSNNNVYPSVPILGLSHVVAVTEKGPVGSADIIIRNTNQFKEIYGSETVPDGSISNIEIALSMGSSLRISRVDTESGDESTSASWIKALEVFKNYDDAYQLFCSHVHQHVTEEEELGKVHIEGGKIASATKSVIYYIEVPKYSEGTTPSDNTKMLAWKQTMSEKVGASAQVAYFGGGFKYYDSNGELQDCDTLGTVVGLGDTAAKNNGPWLQYSGLNRGVVPNAVGIVIPNYGSIGNYEALNSLAEKAINVSVIKETRTQGKKPVLWHNFTDTDTDDSEKYLGVERLILYIKKSLRPIVESYLEEPNTFETWYKMYLEGKKVFDDLIDKVAITEYQWLGDQEASSYDDLSVNTEADVRAGKYKAMIKFKEVVGMQEITIELIIDSVNNTLSMA